MTEKPLAGASAGKGDVPRIAPEVACHGYRLQSWEVQLISEAILTCACGEQHGCAVCQGWAAVLTMASDEDEQ